MNQHACQHPSIVLADRSSSPVPSPRGPTRPTFPGLTPLFILPISHGGSNSCRIALPGHMTRAGAGQNLCMNPPLPLPAECQPQTSTSPRGRGEAYRASWWECKHCFQTSHVWFAALMGFLPWKSSHVEQSPSAFASLPLPPPDHCPGSVCFWERFSKIVQGLKKFRNIRHWIQSPLHSLYCLHAAIAYLSYIFVYNLLLICLLFKSGGIFYIVILLCTTLSRDKRKLLSLESTLPFIPSELSYYYFAVKCKQGYILGQVVFCHWKSDLNRVTALLSQLSDYLQKKFSSQTRIFCFTPLVQVSYTFKCIWLKVLI